MLQVTVDAVEIVGPKRAGWASRLVVRSKHEMIDDQLGLSRKKISQCRFAVGRVEDISLLHALPRQLTPLLTQFVPQACKFFFFREKRCSRRDPVLVRYDFL